MHPTTCTLFSRSLVAACLLALTACGSSGNPSGAVANTPPVDAQPDPRVEKFVVKDPQLSAAFLDTHDLNGDGVQEIILSTLIEVNAGPPNASSRGALRIFESSTGTLEGPWDETVVISTTDALNNGEGWPFINTPQVLDVDGDGIRDIVVQTGFLLTNGGAHFAMLGTGNDNLDFPHTRRVYFDTTTRKELSNNYYWHESDQVDLDGDGLIDLVTTSGQTQRAQNPTGGPVCDEGNQPNGRCAELKVEWYRNTGTTDLAGLPVFDYHRIAPDLNVGGVFIKLHDVDGDLDQDIVLSQFFGPPAEPSILWLENVEAPSADNNFEGVWAEHVIDRTIGLGYHLEFADLNGDGREDLVIGNHNNQEDPRLMDENGVNISPPGMFWFEVPDDPQADQPWTKHVIDDSLRVTINFGSSPQSQGVPGIFNVGDLNGDGRPDLAVPGDGNNHLYAYLQNPDGSFERLILDTGLTFGMAQVVDVDGDGINEVVAANHNSLNGAMSVDFPPGFLAIYRLPQVGGD